MTKRPGIKSRQLRDGRMAYDVKYRDQFKKQHMKTFYKVREAEAFRDSIKTDIRSGVYVPPKNITIQEAAEKWLKLREDSIRGTTLGTYRAAIKWIIEYFHQPVGEKEIEKKMAPKSLLLRNISLENCKEFVSYLQRKKLAPATISKIVTVLKSIFQEAADNDNIAKNPTRLLKKPKIPKAKRYIPTAKEIDQFIENIDEFYRPLTETLAYTGLRISEALALRWENIDLKGGWLSVEQTIQSGQFFPTKTDESMGRVAIPDWLVDKLRLHKARQSVELDKNKFNLVFTNKSGAPINRHNFYHREWKEALQKTGLPLFGFHTLRHFYASELVARGIDIKTVQEQVRHSSIEMTGNIYTHTNHQKVRQDINEKLGRKI